MFSLLQISRVITGGKQTYQMNTVLRTFSSIRLHKEFCKTNKYPTIRLCRLKAQPISHTNIFNCCMDCWQMFRLFPHMIQKPKMFLSELPSVNKYYLPQLVREISAAYHTYSILSWTSSSRSFVHTTDFYQRV